MWTDRVLVLPLCVAKVRKVEEELERREGQRASPALSDDLAAHKMAAFGAQLAATERGLG